MPDRSRIHIVANGEDWVGPREGGARPSFHAATETEAIERGREFAQRDQGEILILEVNPCSGAMFRRFVNRWQYSQWYGRVFAGFAG